MYASLFAPQPISSLSKVSIRYVKKVTMEISTQTLTVEDNHPAIQSANGNSEEYGLHKLPLYVYIIRSQGWQTCPVPMKPTHIHMMQFGSRSERDLQNIQMVKTRSDPVLISVQTPDLRCPPSLSRRRRQITPSVVGVNSARLSPSPQYRHRRQLSCAFSWTSSLRKHVLKCLDDHQKATNSTNTSFDQNVDMIAKFDKYWSDIPGVMAMAVVLDRRYKILLVDFHFSKIYGSSAYSQREIVHELFKDLIKEYELGSSSVEQLNDNSLDHSFDIFGGAEEFE
ncbi:hypothetical protein Ddye_021632 [Dipteronia dyeriana]|uniref:hAT-like transposase RNase-H fold domain-containing protein n=1 Tax=Dipteronia dyeriana TaxID=168575 RepID=A0AAD9U2K1_9ROSI|nr:hypothetical protein Ddye_021632 [Dipteronia dyeriana]